MLRIHARGHDQVHAIGSAVHMGVDPLQFNLETLRCMTRRAENAEAAGLAHFCDHVATMAEREEREFNAETFAEFGFHGCYSGTLGE